MQRIPKYLPLRKRCRRHAATPLLVDGCAIVLLFAIFYLLYLAA